MPVFNPRARYLTGLGFDPRQRYLTGLGLMRRQRRLLMGRFNPRMRYLTGLGDSSVVNEGGSPYDAIDANAIIASQIGPTYTYTPPSALVDPSLIPYPTSSTPGTQTGTIQYGAGAVMPSIVNAQGISTPLGVPVAAPSATSWFNTINPTLGVSNLTLVLGLGGLALLAIMGGSKRR